MPSKKFFTFNKPVNKEERHSLSSDSPLDEPVNKEERHSLSSNSPLSTPVDPNSVPKQQRIVGSDVRPSYKDFEYQDEPVASHYGSKSRGSLSISPSFFSHSVSLPPSPEEKENRRMAPFTAQHLEAHRKLLPDYTPDFKKIDSASQPDTSPTPTTPRPS